MFLLEITALRRTVLIWLVIYETKRGRGYIFVKEIQNIEEF